MITKSYTKTLFATATLILLGACSDAPKKAEALKPTTTKPSTSKQVGIKGKLLSFDGKPMSVAQVQVRALNDISQKKPLKINVAKDGSYALSLTANNHYALTFTGLSHEQITYIIDYKGDESLGLSVNLDYLPLVERPENITLLMFSKGAERPRFEQLTKTDDGSYGTTIEVAKSKFSYQFDGASQGPHIIGNPNQGPYKPSDYGDFATLVDHGGGAFTVNYQHAYQANPYSQTPLKLTGNWGEQQQSLALQHQYGRLLSEQRIASSKANTNNSSGEYTFTKGIDTLAQLQQQYQGTIHADMLLAMSTALIGQQNSAHKQAFERFDGKTPWLHLPEVNFKNIMQGAAASNDGGEKAYLDLYLANKDKFNHYLRHFNDDEQKGEHIATLAYSFKQSGDKANYRELFSQLQQRYSHVSNFNFFAKMLAPPALQEGSSIPEFSITAMNKPDTTYTHKSFKDKLVLIDFWATWCAPCIKEMPDLHHAYQEYQSKGFEILSLSADIDKADVTNFINGKWKMPWQHAFLDSGEHPMVQDFSIVGYPAAFLVNEQGVVVATGEKVRGKQLLATLNELYKAK